MILRVLLASAVIGAIFGFLYAWNRSALSTNRVINDIRSVPIDEADKSQRRQRAKAIGYTRGLRLSFLLVMTAVGTAIGLILGLIAAALMWIGGQNAR